MKRPPPHHRQPPRLGARKGFLLRRPWNGDFEARSQIGWGTWLVPSTRRAKTCRWAHRSSFLSQYKFGVYDRPHTPDTPTLSSAYLLPLVGVLVHRTTSCEWLVSVERIRCRAELHLLGETVEPEEGPPAPLPMVRRCAHSVYGTTQLKCGDMSSK